MTTKTTTTLPVAFQLSKKESESMINGRVRLSCPICRFTTVVAISNIATSTVVPGDRLGEPVIA